MTVVPSPLASSPAAYADLQNGEHRFEVRATDTAGNIGTSVSHTWTVDATVPQATSDHLHHSGTFNGNLMTMAAGRVTLDLLTQREIVRINALGERLADGLRRTLDERPDLQGVVNSCGSLLHVNFGTGSEVRKYSDLNLDSPVAARFHLAALDEGVYFAPRGFMNMSTAMDEQVVDDVLEACSRAMERAADPVKSPG